MAKASSVRNSERSPGSPPAVTLSTVPDANPAARLIDRPDAASCVSSVRTTERSSSSSCRESTEQRPILGALVRSRAETMHDSNGDIRATEMIAEICDESLASSVAETCFGAGLLACTAPATSPTAAVARRAIDNGIARAVCRTLSARTPRSLGDMFETSHRGVGD